MVGQNTLLFASPDDIASNADVAEARAKTRDRARDVVHPEHYQRVVESRECCAGARSISLLAL